jgi:outer membrane protein assembly factor BamD
MISELQEKLEQKNFEIAKQYHTTRDYKPAIKANDNFIANFPGTKFREEALFVKFKASYVIALNSIPSKKLERLETLRQQYNIIIRYYPETLFLEELENMIKKVDSEINQLNKTNTSLSK